MKKINLTITIGELQVLNKCLSTCLKPKGVFMLDKALFSILIKLSEKLQKRALSKLHHQDNDVTKFSFEYYEAFALHKFLNEINLDFEEYPYESNVFIKIMHQIFQQS